MTRLPCFAFYFCLVKRYSVANASPSPRIYRSFCFLLLTSPASSSILKRAASRNRLAAFLRAFARPFTAKAAQGSRFLSLFFRAASPMTRLPCFAFYFCLVKRYSVANASFSARLPVFIFAVLFTKIVYFLDKTINNCIFCKRVL